MDQTDRVVRQRVLQSFLEHAYAPTAPEIAQSLGLPIGTIKDSFRRLDDEHHLKLLEGTFRILMAFPFSAISTPYRVTRPNGQSYFANCAWDAIAFHLMLDEPTKISSYCDICGTPIGFSVEDGRGRPGSTALPLVRLALPAARWWEDITRTCANTMVFLGAEEVGLSDLSPSAATEAGIVTVDQVVQMSVPLYRNKMASDYDRPSPEVIRANFERIGFTGDHWRL